MSAIVTELCAEVDQLRLEKIALLEALKAVCQDYEHTLAKHNLTRMHSLEVARHLIAHAEGRTP